MSASIVPLRSHGERGQMNPDNREPRSVRAAGSRLRGFIRGAKRCRERLNAAFWVLVLAAVIASVCGLLISPYLYLVAIAIAGLVVTGIVWPAVAIRGLRCRLRFDLPRCREKQPVTIRLEIRNRWPWPLWGISLGGFAGSNTSHSGASPGMSLARIPGRSTSEFVWKFTPERRGVYPVSQPHLETSFPFDLLKAKRAADCSGELIVWPDAYPVRSVPHGLDEGMSDILLADRREGEFGDVLGTREFREGDALRRIHWGQSARLGRLIVCERQAPAKQRIAIVLDAAAADTLEDQIRIVAGVAESLQRFQTHLEVCLGARRIAVDARDASLKLLFDELARIPADGVCEREDAASARGSSLQIVVTSDHRVPRWVRRSRSASNRRIVVVYSPGGDRAETHDAWITLESGPDLERELGREWERACHAG